MSLAREVLIDMINKKANQPSIEIDGASGGEPPPHQSEAPLPSRSEQLVRKAAAAEALKKNPARSNRSIGREVGLNPRTVYRVRLELEENCAIPGPDRKDGIGGPGPGRRALVPANLIELVRKGMAMNIGDIRKTAEQIDGVSNHVFALARRLLILSDRDILVGEEKEALQEALALLAKGRVGDATRASAAVIKRHWDAGTKDGRYKNGTRNATPKSRVVIKARKKQEKRFENTLFLIRQTCDNNDEMIIPELTVRERNDAVNSVWSSIRFLFNLIDKIKGEKDRDNPDEL